MPWTIAAPLSGTRANTSNGCCRFLSVPAASAPPAVAHSQRVLLLVALVAINAVSSIDRVAILTIGPAIKTDLTLSDLEFGLAAGFGFALFYAFLGLPIARLADSRSR